MGQTITSLIEKLEGAEVGSRELDCAVARVLDCYKGFATEHLTTSLDAALALAERVLGGKEALLLLTDLLTREAEASDFDSIAVSDLPRLFCAAILRAQSEARV